MLAYFASKQPFTIFTALFLIPLEWFIDDDLLSIINVNKETLKTNLISFTKPKGPQILQITSLSETMNIPNLSAG